MKTIRSYRNSFFALLTTGLLASSVIFSSCDKDDEDINKDDMYTLSGNASSSQEVPSNTSTGSGTLSGTYNSKTNMLSYTINWTGLSNAVTVAHFHGPAEAGVNASPMVDIMIGTNGTAGVATSSSVTITDAAEVALLAGKMYYNLHTALYPNGEIRGQVTTTKQ